MKRMKNRCITFTLAALPALLSFTPASEQAPFADKYWVYESSTVVPAVDLDMDGKPDNSISVLITDCQKDDAKMFKSGGAIVEDYGKIKCEEDEERTEETGEWTYNAATRQITTKSHNTDDAEVVTLREISASRMVISRTFRSKKGEHVITAVYRTR